MTGEDGGYALATDGKSWTFSRNLAIGQFYHIAASNENPYLGLRRPARQQRLLRPVELAGS